MKRTKKEMQARIDQLGSELMKAHHDMSVHGRRVDEMKKFISVQEGTIKTLRHENQYLIKALTGQLAATSALHLAATPAPVDATLGCDGERP